jgi:DNA repair exonuclease SbcCD nuclease subunit
VRNEFLGLMKGTGWGGNGGAGKLLCLHQTIEGARVGPSGYTFRKGQDVIRRSDLPQDAVAVLSGHIHRRQILGNPNNQNGKFPPVIYPGSTERTSFAERDENKGFYEIELTRSNKVTWGIQRLEFIELPARPMEDLFIERTVSSEDLRDFILRRVGELAPDSILRLRCDAKLEPEVKSILTSRYLREILPETMNYQFSADFRQWRG